MQSFVGTGVALVTPFKKDFSVDFEALISTDDPVAWIMWEFGDGSTGFGANVTHNYTSPGVYSVKITVTTVAGCQDIRIYQDLIVDNLHFSFVVLGQHGRCITGGGKAA